MGITALLRHMDVDAITTALSRAVTAGDYESAAILASTLVGRSVVIDDTTNDIVEQEHDAPTADAPDTDAEVVEHDGELTRMGYPRCMGITKSGTRCGRNAAKDSVFCDMHATSTDALSVQPVKSGKNRNNRMRKIPHTITVKEIYAMHSARQFSESEKTTLNKIIARRAKSARHLEQWESRYLPLRKLGLTVPKHELS